jgi:hypothetical protein
MSPPSENTSAIKPAFAADSTERTKIIRITQSTIAIAFST